MPSSLNADNGVVSGTAGLKSSADSSGVLDLQTNGTTAISISASQVVSFANQPTYTGGTANGVMFLNGSKAVTTGTALTFDGANLGVGTASPGARIDAVTASGDCVVRLGNGTSQARFAVDNDGPYIYALTSGDISLRVFSAIGSQAMTLDASGNLEIGGTFAQGRKLAVDSSTNGYTMQLLQTSAFSSGNLAGTVYSGYYDGSSITDMASIRGGKENTTSGNFAGMLAFYTRANGGSDTERARIDSSGRLGIGVTSPQQRLDIAGALRFTPNTADTGYSADIFANYDSAHPFQINVKNNGSTSEYMGVYADGGGANNRVVFPTGNVGIGITNPAYQLQMSGGTTVATRIQLNRGSDDANQNLRLGWNAIKTTRLSTALSGVQTNLDFVQVGSDGERTCFSMGTNGALEVNFGIKFPATQISQANANTLDDYEEGTFTPVIQGGTTAGTYTSALAEGVYVKIGKQVTVSIRVAATNFTGTGDFIVAGLPFAAAYEAVCPVQFNVNPFSNLLTGPNQIVGIAGNTSATTIIFRACDTDTTGGNFNQLTCGSSTVEYLRVGCTYYTS